MSVKLCFVTDASGQSVRPVVKSEAWPWSMGSIDCPETSVTHYHSQLRKITEARRSNFRSRREPEISQFFQHYSTLRLRLRN